VERERLNASIRNLDVENAGLRKELRDLIDEYDKLTGNNDSLMVSHLNPYLSSYLPVSIDF